MSAEADFRACLLQSAPVAALVTHVSQNAAPEGAVLPFVVFTASHSPILNISGDALSDEVTFTVECWATAPGTADQVADAIEAALAVDPYHDIATVTSRASGFDGETQLDATVLIVTWWV